MEDVQVILCNDVIFNVPMEIMFSMEMDVPHVHVQHLVLKSNVVPIVMRQVMFEMKMGVKHVNVHRKLNVLVQCVECSVKMDLNAMKTDANIAHVIHLLSHVQY